MLNKSDYNDPEYFRIFQDDQYIYHATAAVYIQLYFSNLFFLFHFFPFISILIYLLKYIKHENKKKIDSH